MLRRIHHPIVRAGRLVLEPAQAHHVRDVLRLGVGDELELFDDAGATAAGVIEEATATEVVVRIEEVRAHEHAGLRLAIASAVPKAQRADWMIEKLSELGVGRFIPLITARSVVKPEGKNKLERWRRLATEAARQSRRDGVMRIEELTALEEAVRWVEAPKSGIPRLEPLGGEQAKGWYLSTAADAEPIGQVIQELTRSSPILFIGPEGGWTDEEIRRFSDAGLRGVSLTRTVLRIETAAVAAAAIVGVMRGR